MAMVKADAYGHGLLATARAFNAADGLAVARLQEAVLLRGFGIEQRILLLGTLLDEADLALCSQQLIDVTAHDRSSVASIAAQAGRTPLRVWLKLDCGMHRVGLNPDAFVEADRVLSGHPGILELIHITHFSSATETATRVMEQQIGCFWACHMASSKAKVSLANSAALIARPETRADWVRPGIMLYGDNPFGPRHPVPLRAAMTLRAHIIAVREIGAGESVGYNGRWTSARQSRIATIGIGYGDGYPRHARNGTPVWINGQLAPLVGQVSMDSLTVDATDCRHMAAGDEATLWGPELAASVVAEYANTIPYELFTSLQRRVGREYTGHD
jgi:alanine racemase